MWQTEDNKLHRQFEFKDFEEAVTFMNKVAAIARVLNHHPTVHNTYNKVDLWLSTHDAGDVVTEKDEAFAKRVDQLFTEPPVDSVAAFPQQIKLYADGGSRGNPGPSASGYVLMTMEEQILHESGTYLGITTNNQAEYQALKFGLDYALKHGVREVDVYMDSLLVINQMKGLFKVKNRDLWPIHNAIQDLAKQLKKVTYTHVPREFNKLADAEVNKCLDAQTE
ncbi:MAG TPA: reverse transcriptase-like protein [Patescibacteria group bacterium]|nr:reverse transcriptase-like protein [Patescibacteria group bacterium]